MKERLRILDKDIQEKSLKSQQLLDQIKTFMKQGDKNTAAKVLMQKKNYDKFI